VLICLVVLPPPIQKQYLFEKRYQGIFINESKIK
jgi:hypothetical protein